jgi:DNA repair exonuclease SbcCD ATPase subunit
MIDTFEFLDELKGTFEPSQAEVLARLMGRLYKELANTVTKAEFVELTRVVNELSNNIKTLSERIDRLAEFQVKAEERFAKVEERLTRLEKVVEELAEAQKRTEERVTRLEKVVEELAEAQKKTEERLNELAEAQKRTEEVIKELAKDLGVTKRQLGDLSDTVGYTLENSAYKALPELLKRDYGIKVIGRLKRGYLRDIHGRPVEVNILGEATKNGKRITIIGESKARLSKKAIDKFVEKRLKAFGGVIKDIFPVIVTHMISEPDAEEHAKKKGVALYYSYDF